MTPKPGPHPCSGTSTEDTYLLAVRCPVFRRRDFDPGFRTELETLVADGKRKGTSGEPARPKVSKRRPGSDCSIVVMKRGNARGAKGAGHSGRDRRVNGQPEEPTGVGGRRQPSGGDTSRMSGDAHVRFCERLGGRLPGPTRRWSVRGASVPYGRQTPVLALVASIQT